MEARTAGAPSFGAWLKQRRRFLDLTQEQLADGVGCSAATIVKIESGDRRPSLQMAELLAERLQVPAGEREACLLLARGRSAEPATSALTEHAEQTGPASSPATNPPIDLPAQLTSLLGREVQIEEAARPLSGARHGSPPLGGRILLTPAAEQLVRERMPEGTSLRDLGEAALQNLLRPEHIFQLQAQADGLPAEFPPLRTLGNHPSNLPIQLTPFIGREKERGEVAALLRNPDVRLLTLTGSGGIGKTRFALQAAADLLASFPDGVWFVELAALVEPKQVIPTIAATLAVNEAGATPLLDTLNGHLKDKHLLLVLDNFEQVIGAATEVSDLLSSGMGLKVLVTSRTPLRLRGEHEYAVPPLSLPDYRHLPTLDKLFHYEGVRLFIERAVSVKADFQVTDENAPAVAEICVRLDGLPLAIELAAARVKMLSPQALLTRLAQRLKVLTGGARDLSARQQTLRATIDWSYDLLDDAQKQLFSRMAVFQGGRTFDALDTVCNYDGQLQLDVLEGVQSLLDKSLLQQREGRDGEPRLWLLETIHEYAREKLGESGEAPALKKEHALYFMSLAEEAEPHLTGKHQQEWLDRLEDEYDNLRAALVWAGERVHRSSQEGSHEANQESSKERSHKANQESSKERGERSSREAAEIGLRTAGAIWRYWQVRGLYAEGRERLEGVLSVPEMVLQVCSAASRAKAMNGAGYLAWCQGDYSSARSLTEVALMLGREAEDKRSMSSSLHTLAIVASAQGDYTTARALLEESLALGRELRDKWAVANELGNLGVLTSAQGDYTTARALLEESLALSRELGDNRGIAN
jgi:predicted ATPase/transcriptional regulator with XRE-family HTH domain